MGAQEGSINRFHSSSIWMMIHPYSHNSFNKLKYHNVFFKVGQKDTPKKMLLKNNPRSQFQSQVGTCDKGMIDSQIPLVSIMQTSFIFAAGGHPSL